MVSIIHDQSLIYPGEEDFYSPDEAFPEYPFDHISKSQNNVYRAVRDCFIQAGLDSSRFGTPEWNPLGIYIKPGKRVFILCNFVYHQREFETLDTFWSKCTHGSVLRAIIDYVIIAAGKEGSVNFGNAPLQSCNWDKVLNATGASSVLAFYKKNNQRVQALDLRLFVAERTALGNISDYKKRDEAGSVSIDLGKDSLLDELYQLNPNQLFRVSDYNPERIHQFHGREKHIYVINKQILEADVVFSLPKLKTHEKVGITCNLKGFVGAIGHKDCLAHHRFGDGKEGGDEYPERKFFQRHISKFHDWVYARKIDRMQPIIQIIDRSIRRLYNKLGFIQAGAWQGNDTAWRMSLDIARIIHYGKLNGEMSNEKQRVNLSMIDGIISGEGKGPLSPTPVKSRVLTFSDNVAIGDRIACQLMGYDFMKIPLIRKSFNPIKYRIASEKDEASLREICFNKKIITEKSVAPIIGRSFIPPNNWDL